eukprot:gene5487-5363_t
MSKLYKPLLDELGLSYPQYLVMLVGWGSTRARSRPYSNATRGNIPVDIRLV